jgi:hypothetical protein
VHRKGHHWYWLPLDPEVVIELRASFQELQPELDDHLFTVEVEQWVSQYERVRRVTDPKVPASGYQATQPARVFVTNMCAKLLATIGASGNCKKITQELRATARPHRLRASPR